jgi:alkylation response protein AidB-like acyl-CoA dehydrogenase
MPYKTFGFSEQQILVRDQVLKLLQRVAPDEKLDAWERASAYPEEAYQTLAAEGYLALPFAEEFGGGNAGHRDLAVFIEALAYHHPGIASAFMTTIIYGGMYIQYHGTPEQKREFLPEIIAGRRKMAVAYTEPSGGSDAAAIKTRAVREGNDYVIAGQKVFITNAHVADCLVVTAKTRPEGGHNGLSLFIVDTKAPGVTIRPLNPMGRRTSLPNEVFLDGVRVPATRMLGEESRGWSKMMRGLNLERVLIGASSAGQCLKIIDIARDWATQRTAFGKTITEYQAISHKFADMMMLTESARLHTYAAADMLDQGVPAVIETSMAKTIATENNMKVADLGVQIMGGAGYMDGPMSRLYRDARVGPIGGGSSEIMRNVIAKLMGVG